MKNTIKTVIFTTTFIASTTAVLAQNTDMSPMLQDNYSYSTPVAVSSVQQTIILDGAVFHPSAPLQVINDRLLVPFREIGEAMDATVNWQEEHQRVTMFRGNRYSIMHIGHPSVQYGEFTVDDAGNIVFTTQNFSQMDAPPVIINNLTYIPLRAISETLGATVSWNEFTSTATIVSSPITTPSPTPPTANPTPLPEDIEEALPPNFGDFSNTSHFRVISSRQANARFEDSDKEPFILVAYDSTSFYSKKIVPDIQDAAQSANLRIYGLDKSSANNVASENAWMWSFVRQANFQDPTIFYIYARNNVVVDVRPDVDNLEDDFRAFHILTETGIEMGDFRNTNHFRNVTSREIETMHRNNEEFIFVLYDSSDDYSAFFVPIIKAAARETEHRIYAVDIDTNPSYRNHLSFAPGIDSSIHRRIPMMYLVYSDTNRHRTEVYDRPQNVDTAISLIEEFLDNSIYHSNNTGGNNSRFEDIDHDQFINVSAANITNRFRRGDEFIVVVYDSADLSSRATVERIRDAAIVAGPPIFAVNLSSTEFNNTNREDLLWLDLIPANTRRPVMIHFDNQRLGSERFMTFRSTNSEEVFRDAFNFIQDVYPPR